VKYNPKFDFYGKSPQKIYLKAVIGFFLCVCDVTLMHALWVYCCALEALRIAC